MSLIVAGGYMFTGEDGEGSCLVNAAAYVEGDEIVAVGPLGDMRRLHADARVVGGTDAVVMPGLVDGHQHGRGLTYVQRGVRDERLELWLYDLRTSAPIDPYAATLWSALHSLAAGITTSVHSHVTTRASDYHHELLESIEAYKASGLRTTFAIDFRDRGTYTYEEDAAFVSRLPEGIRSDVIQDLSHSATPRPDDIADLLPTLQSGVQGTTTRLCLGPQAASRCTRATLSAARELASQLGLGLHMHFAESRAQMFYFRRTFGTSEVEYLHTIGILASDVSLAHGIWLTSDDIEILADAGVTVVHCPSSNLRLGSGVMRLGDLMAAGVPVAVGTDSMTLNEDYNLFGEMRLAAGLLSMSNNAGSSERRMDPAIALSMALTAGSRAAFRPERLGVIQPGWKADLILLDRTMLEHPYSADLPDSLRDLIYYRANASHVRSVIVGGQLVADQGRFPGVDIDGLAERIASFAVTGTRQRAASRPSAKRVVRQQVMAYLDEMAEASFDDSGPRRRII